MKANLWLRTACAVTLAMGTMATEAAAAEQGWFQWLKEQGAKMVHVFPSSGKGHDVNDTMAEIGEYRAERGRGGSTADKEGDRQTAEEPGKVGDYE